jgi:protein quaking
MIITTFFQPEGEDELKRKQLMELAIINGTYRPAGARADTAATALAKGLLGAAGMQMPTPASMRSGPSGAAGAPLILSPTRANAAQSAQGVPHAHVMVHSV